MRDKVFIDTNIWLYSLIHSKDDAQKHQQAARFLSEMTSEIIVSTQVTNEICSNLLRKGNKSNEFLHTFLLDFTSSHTIVSQTKNELLTGSTLRQNYSFSFWDSLIIASALNADCTILYSEDMQNGLTVFNQLQVINPLLTGKGEGSSS